MGTDRNLVTLPDCCKNSLKEIHDALIVGKIGSGLLVVAPILTMIGNPIDVAAEVGATKAGGDIGEALAGTEAPGAAEVFGAMGELTKETCRRISGTEALSHRGPPLSKFWAAMYKRFE